MADDIDFEAEGLLGDLEGKAREARLALLKELTDQGVSLEELKRAVEEHRLVLLPVERVFDEGADRYTVAEIGEKSGLDPGFLARLLQALGAPIPEHDERVYAEADVEAAKRAKLFLDAGLPEDGVLETSRLIGISMANLADANVDLVGEVFTEPGVDERELALRYAAAAKTMAPLLGETLLHAYRIHLRERIRQAVITEAELAEGRLSGSDEVTIAFADLVGFTRLGESLEIEQIGDLTGRLFEARVRRGAVPGPPGEDDRGRRDVLLTGVGAAARRGRRTGRVRGGRRRSRRCGRAWRAGQALGRGGGLVRAAGEPGGQDHQLRPAGQRRRRPGGQGLDRPVRRAPFDFSFAGQARASRGSRVRCRCTAFGGPTAISA